MKVKSKIFYWYIAFVVIYVAVTLLPSPDKATITQYHLSASGIRALDLTIIIPVMLIWWVAFYGYTKLHAYSQAIKGDAESRHIATLSRGLLLLSIGLPISAIVSSLLTLLNHHLHGFDAVAIIVKNYANVAFPLAAFICISIGARGLSDLRKTRPRLLLINAVILAVIALGIIFCCLIVLNHRTLRTTYHMSPQLVMLSLGVPYMYLWFLGLQASTELHAYSKNVTGIVYRKGWNTFIAGLAAIILTSILIQYLTALSTWLTSLTLGWLLLLLYALLILLASAYIVVALGTKELMKIEEA